MSLADDSDDVREEVYVVDVLECNRTAIDVFGLCQVGGVGHMGGIAWNGIEPGAIRAACLLLRIPRAQWTEVAKDVAYMGRCVAQERNREAAERARR